MKYVISVFYDDAEVEVKTNDVEIAILEMLKADSNIREAILEWNPGGHFNDADGRLIRGIRWMQEAMQNRAVP